MWGHSKVQVTKMGCQILVAVFHGMSRSQVYRWYLRRLAWQLVEG